MSFLQQDPRVLQEQNNTNVLQDDAGTAPEGQVSSEAQNAPSQGNQASTGQISGSTQKLPNTGKNAPRSGMFTNIKNYIDKNKVASQKMAESVGQAIQKKQDIAKKNLQNVQQRFGSNVEAGTLKNRDTAIQEIQSRANEAAGRQQQEQAPTAATDDRFKDIIDTKYEGPHNLFETSGYGDATSKVEKAKALKSFSESPEQYQTLLDQTLSMPGKNYTSGQKKLDELLFGRQDAQQAFKEKTKDLGDINKYFEEQKAQSRQLGTGREKEIDDIRSGARSAFGDIATERDDEVEGRLSQVVQDWDKLPEHFRDIFRQGAKSGNINLSQLEAKTLGVKGGEQLFDALKLNKPEDIIKATASDKAKLISKNEQAQLAELQRLAGLSQDYGTLDSDIDYRSAYQDVDKAGTQTAVDAIDSGNLQSVLRDALDRGKGYLESGYREQGIGQDRYKRFGRSSKTVTAHADAAAKMKDVLDKQYVDKVLGTKNEDVNVEQDLSGLKNMAKFLDENQKGQSVSSDGVSNLNTAVGGGGDTIDDTSFDAVDAATQIALGNTGGVLADITGIDALKYMNPVEMGLGATDLYSKGFDSVGLTDVSRAIDKITGTVGGYLGGYKKKAKSNAARFAQADANRKLNATLQNKANEQQIGKQIGVNNDAKTKARTQALINLLGNIDKTNL